MARIQELKLEREREIPIVAMDGVRGTHRGYRRGGGIHDNGILRSTPVGPPPTAFSIVS